MAMLAEPKRKQRWSLNPRGKHWSEDSNKFGQKLLEKMGWTHGKGLGANEDGITENIKLSYKNDSKGMGYKETEQWTEHDANFSELLQSLSNSPQIPKETEQTVAASLELKSQNSKVRVHYHKFTRGKDITRYSEKDLANIFGRKTLKPAVKQQPVEEREESNENLLERGSMTDYFKKKMPSFGKNSYGYVVGNNGVLTKDESDDDVPSFGFGFPQKSCDDDDDVMMSLREPIREFNEANVVDARKSKKLNKQKIRNENGDENDKCVLNNEVLRKKKKKAKRESGSLSVNQCAQREEIVDENRDKEREMNANGAVEACDEENGSEAQIATIDSNVECTKRRKNKKKKRDVSDDGDHGKSEPTERKKTKKRKVDDANDLTDVGNKLEKSLVKKRKSKKNKREKLDQ